ncbi:PREDICTED: uncharacterized protein LOC105959417 [Erythranthe guttata]|uniref:uncharacterized protein LOC105959417 n=1 Tax=Erythranthe guttata TaxID=4155 RepID=UPI00064D7667|nr:PREDICTED: uncharacterized protein LOC105959417 [Erythranthe guttata]|eukprot:XP_012838972.1 PREDICTED: uncharacterized protein LOC105959417 [Erythranthe guttata]
MGKVPTAAAAATTEVKIKKKKGRPPKNRPPLSAAATETPVPNSTGRRSTRRNPNQLNSPPQPEFDEDEDDDDERKEKKVKLVVRLPQSDEKRLGQSGPDSRDYDSGSGSGSEPESEDRERSAKKRRINGVDRGSDDGVLDQDDNKEDVVAANTPPPDGSGSPLEPGPTTTPLPDKKLLAFILDRLQKKDTYGVFSEPVDPNELPDYFEIVEQPMDFGTVRKKLNDGAYKNLEELEADVLLICSNAMQYNSSDTVYFRQARSIQEVAKRDFKNLKHEGDDGEPQPKVVRRGRPPNSKNQKKSPEASVLDRVGTDIPSGATLATGEEKQIGSNSYNLRKGPALYRVRSTDHSFASPSRNGENYSEWLVDWNNEFPASILRADMKHGKKNFTVDENKRDTYRQSDNNNNSPVYVNAIGNMKRLMPLGLQETLAYARSLSRYAANLGPVAWKMASSRIEAVLPAGVQYGPGWVGDDEAPSQLLIEKQKLIGKNTTTNLSSSDVVEAVKTTTTTLNSQNEVAASMKTPFPPQHKIPTNHESYRNGLNGTFGYRIKSPDSQGEALDLSSQRRTTPSVPPDLNVRVPAGSPSSSSLQIGSPQQPDLALQL